MSIISEYINKILLINPSLRQSAISFTSKISLTILGFISTMYIAHKCGPSIYGDFALFLAYFAFLKLIWDSGLGSAAVKKIAEGKEKESYFTAYIFLTSVIGIAEILILYLLKDFFPDLLESGILYFLIIAIIVSIFSAYSTNGIYSTGKIGILEFSRIAKDFSRLVLQIIAIFLGFGIAGLVGGFIVGIIVGSLINIRYLELKLSRFHRYHITDLLPFAFWIFLSGIGSAIFNHVDVIMLGYFINSTEVGIYRIAFQLTAFATFLTEAFKTVFFPKFSNWHHNGHLSLIENSLSKCFTYGLFLAVPITIGGIILGDKMLYYLYGAAFETGYAALIILLFVQVVNVFMFQILSTLNAINKPKETFKSTFIASIANVLLNITLIPVIGIIGAGLATLISILVNTVIASNSLQKEVSIKVEKLSICHILISSIVMGIFVLLIREIIGINNYMILGLSVIIGGLIYLIILFKLNKNIHDEIKDLCIQFGFPWPKFL